MIKCICYNISEKDIEEGIKKEIKLCGTKCGKCKAVEAIVESARTEDRVELDERDVKEALEELEALKRDMKESIAWLDGQEVKLKQK